MIGIHQAVILFDLFKKKKGDPVGPPFRTLKQIKIDIFTPAVAFYL
ncbi:MAG: hypothetical protein IKO81_00100 [Bacteroidales bacterium]|nr:hypothetical protein [Bacteroidales bacterium]